MIGHAHTISKCVLANYGCAYRFVSIVNFIDIPDVDDIRYVRHVPNVGDVHYPQVITAVVIPREERFARSEREPCCHAYSCS